MSSFLEKSKEVQAKKQLAKTAEAKKEEEKVKDKYNNPYLSYLVNKKSNGVEDFAKKWKDIIPDPEKDHDTMRELMKFAGKIHFSAGEGFSVTDIEENMKKAVESKRGSSKAYLLQKEAKESIEKGLMKKVNAAIGKNSWGACVFAYQDFFKKLSECFDWVTPPAEILFSQLVWSALDYDESATHWVTRAGACNNVLNLLNIPVTSWLKDTSTPEEEQKFAAAITIKAKAVKFEMPPEGTRDMVYVSGKLDLAAASYVPIIMIFKSWQVRKGDVELLKVFKDVMLTWNKLFSATNVPRITGEMFLKKEGVTMKGIRTLEKNISFITRVAKKTHNIVRGGGSIRQWPSDDVLKELK